MIPNMAAAMMHLSRRVVVTAVSLDEGDYYGYIAPGGPAASVFGDSGGVLSETAIPGMVTDGLLWTNDGYNVVYIYVAGNHASMSFTSIKIGSVVVPFDDAFYLSGAGGTEFGFYEPSPSTPLPMTAGKYTVKLV